MSKFNLLLILFLLSIFNGIYGENIYYLSQTTITANTQSADSPLGLQWTRISPKRLSTAGVVSVSDLAVLQPNIFTYASGTQVASIGAGGAGYTQVLVNGFSMSDLSLMKSETYLDDVLVHQAQVDILSSSTPLYGTGAVSGVIDIQPTANQSVFDFNTTGKRHFLGMSSPVIQTPSGNVFFQYLHLADSGKSALIHTSEIDKSVIQNIHFSSSWQFNPFIVEVRASAFQSDLGLDNYMSSINMIDDPNFESHSSRLMGQVNLITQSSNQKNVWTYQTANSIRQYENPVDSVDPVNYSSETYTSHSDLLAYTWEYESPMGHWLTKGSYEKQGMTVNSGGGGIWGPWVSTMNQTQDKYTLYGQNQFRILDTQYVIGLQSLLKPDALPVWTYSVSATKPIFYDTDIKFWYAKGYREPSFYERYTLWGGSVTLNSEISDSFSVGFSHRFLNTKLDIFVSSLSINSKIDYVNFKYQNTGKYDNTAYDIAWSMSQLGLLDKLAIGYTANAPSVTTHFYRIPRFRWTVMSESSILAPVIVMGSMIYKGEITDPECGGLPGVFLANLGARYAISESTEASIQITNLFDRIYMDVYGYQTDRRLITLGVRILF